MGFHACQCQNDITTCFLLLVDDAVLCCQMRMDNKQVREIPQRTCAENMADCKMIIDELGE